MKPKKNSPKMRIYNIQSRIPYELAQQVHPDSNAK